MPHWATGSKICLVQDYRLVPTNLFSPIHETYSIKGIANLQYSFYLPGENTSNIVTLFRTFWLDITQWWWCLLSNAFINISDPDNLFYWSTVVFNYTTALLRPQFSIQVSSLARSRSSTLVLDWAVSCHCQLQVLYSLWVTFPFLFKMFICNSSIL